MGHYYVREVFLAAKSAYSNHESITVTPGFMW